MTPKQLGIFGEKIALDYLKNKGYKILDRNYFKKWKEPAKGEIDIVAKKGDTINFIEVKTLIKNNRDPSSAILPEEKVNFGKQRKLIKTAESWLQDQKIPLDTKWQVDVISIKINSIKKRAKIRHFQNAIF